MDMIKVEFTVCHGCLSAQRKVSLVRDNIRLFLYLLGDDPVIKIQEMDDLFLCWECIEMMRKIKAFQNKIRKAYNMLMHSYFQWEDLKSLSDLKCVRKDTYDITIEYDESKLDEENLSIKEETSIPIETSDAEIPEAKEECEMDYDPDSMDHDSDLISSLEKKPNQIREPKKKVKKKHEPQIEIKKQSIRRYEKYATVTKQKEKIINLDQVKLYYEKVYLTDKEMEDVLERRDRKERGFRNMPLQCTVCRLGYKRKKDFSRHNALHHMDSTDTFKCTECKKKFSNKDKFETHLLRHTPMLRCLCCSELCRSFGEMVKHVNRAHTSIYKCKECSAQCGTLREFSIHYKNMHERMVCDYCGKGFFKKKMLEGHIKRNHLPAKCPECGRLYEQYHVLENHMRTLHPHLMNGAADPDASYCVECDKQYLSVYKYRRHILQSARHTPQKRVRVPCPECGKVFTRTTYMNNHYRLVHVKDTKHYCEICNKHFVTGYAVRQHIERVHEKKTMPKNKICDICGRGFSTNRILTNHRRTHTGERPFKCPHCAASFVQRTAMFTHIKTQHKNYMSH